MNDRQLLAALGCLAVVVIVVYLVLVHALVGVAQ